MLWLNLVSMENTGSGVLHASDCSLGTMETHTMSAWECILREETDRFMTLSTSLREWQGFKVSPWIAPWMWGESLHVVFHLPWWLGGQGVLGPVGATGMWGPMPHLGRLTLKTIWLTVAFSPIVPHWASTFAFCHLNSQPGQSHSTQVTGHHRCSESVWHMEAKPIECPDEYKRVQDKNGWSEAEGCLPSVSLCLLL